MKATRWQKLRYLAHTLRFGAPFGGGLAFLAYTAAPYTGDPLILYAFAAMVVATVAIYGVTEWGGSAYDCWPSITVRCKPGAYVDDRQVIRSIEQWGGDPHILSGLTIVVEPGKPPASPQHGEASASQYHADSNTLVTGVEAFERQDHMDAEYDKFVPEEQS